MMNPSTASHEPTPEFRARLEWQIETALRRRARFPVTGGTRRLRVVLVVAIALAAGGIGGIASARVQDARQRDQLIESARSEESLARLRVELARADYQQAQRRFETGTADRETLYAAERQLRAMETSLARLQVDIQEIQATSAAPRNDLQAPLVGGRDFVRERITLDLALVQRELTAAEREVERVRQRIEIGTIPRAALLVAESEMSDARARMQLLRATLELRQRSLRGEIKPEDLAGELRRTELMLQVERAQRAIEIARRRLDEVRTLVEIGRAAPVDAKRVEVDLLEREMELKRAREELGRLGAIRR